MKNIMYTSIVSISLLINVYGCSEPASNTVNEKGESFSTSVEVVASDTLFTLVKEPSLNAEQQRLLSVIHERPTTVEVHLARLTDKAESLLKEDSIIALPVSPDKQFVAVGERLTKRASDDISWSGPIQHSFGQITLVFTAKGVTGTLWAQNEDDYVSYKFEPIGDNLQALIRVIEVPLED